MTKKALVTGSCGFVGSYMLPALEAEGWSITKVDIKEGVDARDFFREDNTRYDLCIHLAAVVGGRALIEGSPLSVAVDLSIDSELFQWALRTKPGRIVYYSSSAAYPVQYQTASNAVRLYEDLIDLEDIRTPDLTYGWAKLSGEMLAGYAREAGVPVTILRPFSGTGPRQTLDYPVPSICARAKRKEDPIEIWSDSVRDIIHMEDVVQLTLTCINEGVDGPLNVCTGVATTFSEVAKMAAEIVGYSPEIKILGDKPTGVHYRVGDPTLMNEVYVPKIPLEEIIRETLET